MSVIYGGLSLLSKFIQKEPGIIVGPITQVLGFIINFIFEIVNKITLENSLGISIILLTIVARVIMLPLAFKQQKSMMMMQKIQPQVEAIKKKYGDSKDPEIQQKMNAEIQSLWAKNKVNPLSGCLPLFIQMPIFFALNYLFQQTFLFVSSIGNLYTKISETIISYPDFASFMVDLARPLVPKGMEIDIALVEHMNKVINKLSFASWEKVTSAMNSPYLNELLIEKNQIEHFFGINLVDVAGWAWPGILIPIFAALTQFLSAYFMNKQNTNQDANMKNQQTIMMIVMPLVMGWFTISFPAGVGLYWVTTNLFQLFQQLVMNKQMNVDKKEGDAK